MVNLPEALATQLSAAPGVNPMPGGQSVQEVIRRRFSCRTYHKSPIPTEKQQRLEAFLATLQAGPFGTSARFQLIAATDQDQAALKGLGTYGFIKDPTAFILGVVRKGAKAPEDFGYLMESAILYATALDLGTCWLGGSFTQSSFARKISRRRDELMPAVTSLGFAVAQRRPTDRFIRQQAGADRRYPWELLFFDGRFANPLTPETAGKYATVLQMVRIGPSASNWQPWRIVRMGEAWHLYLRRTPGYGKGSLLFRLLRLADLQRVDMGIAMCHFELTARELGLAGRWVANEPGLALPDGQTEYIASWVNPA